MHLGESQWHMRLITNSNKYSNIKQTHFNQFPIYNEWPENPHWMSSLSHDGLFWSQLFRVAFEADPTKFRRIASGFAWLPPTAILSSWTRLDLWSRHVWSSPGLKNEGGTRFGYFMLYNLVWCFTDFLMAVFKAVSYWFCWETSLLQRLGGEASLSLWRWNKNRVTGTDPLLLRTFMYPYMLHIVAFPSS